MNNSIKRAIITMMAAGSVSILALATVGIMSGTSSAMGDSCQGGVYASPAAGAARTAAVPTDEVGSAQRHDDAGDRHDRDWWYRHNGAGDVDDRDGASGTTQSTPPWSTSTHPLPRVAVGQPARPAPAQARWSTSTHRAVVCTVADGGSVVGSLINVNAPSPRVAVEGSGLWVPPQAR